ncbi:RHS repeat-associated core domain-containing protein [Myroides sp. M-43]|uniref:RHS repeat domain-containing protein n=1 Tax=Myroides oncorhynchi TaxID=2893756 RepID=UPI001E47C4DD|nr:RHS repeat-associated core domain-containing protein [Myroides oncorhynchi]MCC9043638.1 RHS repeat-associated core domain-containing protein [Myroides oncorhynchi]
MDGFNVKRGKEYVNYFSNRYGNLEVDKHKRISKIKYNHLHLPIEINFGTDKIEYTYTSRGEKVQKIVTDKGVVTKTDYLGGSQYVGGKLSFFPTAEGFYNMDDKAYVYQYRDYLGNVRLSYSDKNKNNTIESNEIIEETNYYPFGLAHSGYNEKSDNLMKDYKYQYNAKEKQEELGLNYYDYGARNYDAAIGRWMNVDPLAEKFVGWNPYHYVHNNPINLVDPTGMRADPPTEGEFENGYVHTDNDGSWTYNNGIWKDNSGGGNDFLEGINFTVPGSSSYGIISFVSGFTGGSQAVQIDAEARELSRHSDGSTDWAAYAGYSLMMEKATNLGNLEMGRNLLGRSSLGRVETAPVKMQGRLGNLATRSQINKISSNLETRGYTIIGGEGRAVEEYLRPLGGGRKGGSYPDITASHPNYPTLRINTVDVLKDVLHLKYTCCRAPADLRS